MSGITPILDTLLHQVLGRRVDIPLQQVLNEPVRPLHPADALPALRSDSRLDPRQPPLTDVMSRPAGASAPAAPVPGTTPAPDTSARTHFSFAARAIAEVLSRFPAPPSAIRPPAPLLDAAPAPGVPVTALAQQLRASIEHSGLFYQAHLARWHRGELPLAVLAREPQMQLTRPVLSQRLLHSEAADTVQRTTAPAVSLLAQDKKNPIADFAMTVRSREQVAETAPHTTVANATSINDMLQGLVRHQLEVLATPVLHWQGDVWAGLFMSLSLGWLPLSPARAAAAEAADDAPQRERDASPPYRWELSLTLSHAHLGRLHGTLHLLHDALAIRLRCEREDVADLLSANSDALCRRLEQAGFDSVRLQIENAERESGDDE